MDNIEKELSGEVLWMLKRLKKTSLLTQGDGNFPFSIIDTGKPDSFDKQTQSSIFEFLKNKNIFTCQTIRPMTSTLMSNEDFSKATNSFGSYAIKLIQPNFDNLLSEYLKMDVNEAVAESKKIIAVNKLSDSQITFDDTRALLKFKNLECQLPVYMNEHYLCREIYKPIYKVGEPIDWSIIYESMTGSAPTNPKANRRTVYDAVEALINRVKKQFKTNDELFTFREKTVTRNY